MSVWLFSLNVAVLLYLKLTIPRMYSSNRVPWPTRSDAFVQTKYIRSRLYVNLRLHERDASVLQLLFGVIWDVCATLNP